MRNKLFFVVSLLAVVAMLLAACAPAAAPRQVAAKPHRPRKPRS